MNFWNILLRMVGWKYRITVPDYPKCIICVAPHTSNWDFIIGEIAIRAAGRTAGFLMKETWFFWPLGPIFRAIGGIPVPRKRGSALSTEIVERFRRVSRMAIAITPEGTRSLTRKWRTGFLHIAEDAGVPIVLAVIDFSSKTAFIEREFKPSGDIDADLRAIKKYYREYAHCGRYSSKFSAEDETCTDSQTQ